MKRKSFWTFFILLQVTFIFSKIYQHYIVATLEYKRQEVRNLLMDHKREKNELLVKLFELSNKQKVSKNARAIGMRELTPNEIINLHDLF
ncbi:MAG TPA: hypothetical protein VJ201_00470 [Candidatus Babeliales bacterium]|nr:hypothetical protein [Candidatus Babeliales bacterium]